MTIFMSPSIGLSEKVVCCVFIFLCKIKNKTTKTTCRLHPNYTFSGSDENINFSDNRLYDASNQLKSDNLKLSVENEQLRSGGTVAAASGSNSNLAKIQALEKRLMSQQEELTDLHKRKGENSQMIVDLNIKLEKQNKTMTEKDIRYGATCYPGSAAGLKLI